MSHLAFEDLPGLIACRLHPSDLRGEWSDSSIDSRSLQAGELFWAMQSDRADGHAYVRDAFEKGAKAAVVRDTWFQAQREECLQGAFVIVDDPLQAMQKLGAANRRRFGIPVIALTGSNGKTSTKEMLAAALGARFRVLKSEGSFNNHIGVPLTLLKIAGDVETAVLEIGTNHLGEIAALCTLAQPTVGLVLNVGPAHLEGFGGIEQVAREKAALLEALPESGAAFINLNDPRVAAMKSPAQTQICYGFSGAEPGRDCTRTLHAELLDMDKEGRAGFRLLDTDFRLAWLGRHQAANALAAAAVAHSFGVPPATIAAVLAALPPIKGRLETHDVGGIRLIDDGYNANPTSTAAALDFLASLRPTGRRLALLGDHLELGDFSEVEHRRIGALCAQRHLDGAYFVGDWMRFAQEECGKSSTPSVHFQTLDHEAIAARIAEDLQAGDVLLIKASRGMKLERVVTELRRRLSARRGNTAQG